MRIFITFNLITSLAIIGLINGCAPRYLDKSPLAIISYSYVPVDQKELANFKALVAINPRDPQAPKAHYWIGQDAFNRERWKLAFENFSIIINRFPKSDWAATAGIMLARIRIKQEKNLVALAGLHKLANQHSSPVVRKAIQELAQKTINDKLSIAELARIRASYPGSDWASQALFVSGKRHLDQGKPDMAIKLFQEFLRSFPASPFARLAQDLIQKATRIIPINQNRIGCLLPISGTYAPYGQTIKQGLELAIKQLNRQRSDDEQLGLVVADTQGTTTGAIAGLKHLRDVEKVMVIIGPALSNEAIAIVPYLQQQPIPTITTSAAKEELPSMHPYLFRYMLTNDYQAEAMAEFMVLQKNFQRIGILSGEAAYDRTLAKAMADKVISLGGEVIATLEYPKRATDFKEQMLALGGIDPGKMKNKEVKERKNLEKLLARTAQQFKKVIAPHAQKEPEADKIKEVIQKRVAIVRFKEIGDEVSQFKLGKTITEKFSYALAPLPGVEVITQADTFAGLRQIKLSPYEIDDFHAKRIGTALNVDYIVLGNIEQTESTVASNPGDPIPLKINVPIRMVSCKTGRVISKREQSWIKSLAPDINTKDMEALYLPVPAQDAILIASQLEFYEIKVPVFGADAWLTPILLRRGQEILEQAIFSTGFWADNPNPRSEEFVKQYEMNFSDRPTLLAAQSFDAMWLVAAILKQLPANRIARSGFQRQLLSMRAFRGITGRAIITPEGDIKRPPLFLQINKGKLRRVN